MSILAAVQFVRDEIARARCTPLSDLIVESEQLGVPTEVSGADWRETRAILGARIAAAKLRQQRREAQ